MMKAKILLIEDNEQNRYLVTFLLEQRGHEVVPAESGPLGLELAAKVLPDLVLLDIQLPGMDGYAMAGDRDRVLAAGAEGYIEKPINPETFVVEVESFLRSSV